MATTVVKTIGSGGDYSTLQAWEDAAPANLVTADQVWEGQMLASTNLTASSTILTIAGSTSDSTRFKRLKCAASASFRDNVNKQTNTLRWNNANGSSISAGDNYGEGIIVSEAFAKLEGLQIKGNGNNKEALLLTGTDIDVDFCIIQGPNVFTNTNDRGRIRNCVLIKTTSGGAGCVLQANWTMVNCTIVKPSDVGTVALGMSCTYLNGACVAKNLAVFGFTTSGTTNGNITYTTCKTDQASPPTGFATLTYDTSMFANITLATADYRLVSGSSLIDAATTDSTNAATDILGSTRPQGSSYDVGAHEFFSASVPTITDFGDESHRVGETGITLTGTNFGASQLSGVVKVSPTDAVGNANAQLLTVESWGNTTIVLTIPSNLSSLIARNTNVYAFVTNDGASSNAAGYVFQITPPPAVLAAGAFLLN